MIQDTQDFRHPCLPCAQTVLRTFSCDVKGSGRSVQCHVHYTILYMNLCAAEFKAHSPILEAHSPSTSTWTEYARHDRGSVCV